MSSDSPLKSGLRNLIRRAVSHDAVWRPLAGLLGRSSYLRIQRQWATEDRFERKCAACFADRTVLAGPFSGLRFPHASELGCAFFPRLTGSYESELHEALERLLAKNPPLVVDVGFAEGYYLVGIGRRLPHAKLVGYDLNPATHPFCRRVAEANNVAPTRLTLRGECQPELLGEWLPARSLVICDSEGFEAKLFAPATAALWTQSDLIIECHDFIVPGATDSIRTALAGTHRLQFISSVTAKSKQAWLQDAKFDRLDRAEKQRLLSEGRPSAQIWIVAEPL